MAEDLDNVIKQNAAGPESAEVEGARMKRHEPASRI
jgi:hypothetical protein